MKKKEIQLLLSVVIFVLIGYFFIWKNFQTYQEKKKEYVAVLEQQEIRKSQKQNLEREVGFLEEKTKKEKEIRKERNWVPFQHILEFEKILLDLLQEEHIELLLISRIVFDEEYVKISMEGSGKWQDVLQCLSRLEQYSKTVFLSQQYLKMGKINHEYVKIQCTFLIQVLEKEERNIDFLTWNTGKTKPYIKIGDHYVYF